MNIIVVSSLIFFLSFKIVHTQPISYFVDPKGNDSNNGSQNSPFKTINRAKQAVANAIQQNNGVMTSDAYVTINSGIYYELPLQFTPTDSGLNGFDIVYQGSSTGNLPIVYFGIPLTDWEPAGSNYPSGVYVTNITGKYTPPVPPPVVPGCGIVEPLYSYNGYDITEVLVPDNDIGACCAACSNQPGCKAWSICINITCGNPGKPINCYLKTSDAGRTYFGPQRVSGTLPETPQWKFYNLMEGTRSGVVARVPNVGSGYLNTLGVSNSDSTITWPSNSPYFPNTTFDVSNSQVFCNLGADWFTETRPITGIDITTRTINFQGSRNGVAGCNGKAYIQGSTVWLDEPGEYALDTVNNLLYYWPYDSNSVLPDSTVPIVAAISTMPIQFQGSNIPGINTTSNNNTLTHNIILRSIEFRLSDFSPDGSYLIFPPGRPNDTPSPTDRGMIRIENSMNITIENCKLLNPGLSAIFIAGYAQNVVIDGNWIENAGFCGIATNGPYPNDPPYLTATDAYSNKNHIISNNLIYNVGTRVGHGAGVWLFQTGNTTITNNYIKESPRNGVGMYGIRFGAGGGLSGGVLPSVLYNQTVDFFSSLDSLTTRNNTVSYNLIENVVRDSQDCGAFETWGVGVGNIFHTNAISDCDSGGVDGSWMNFLFQDDASHYLNHSSNIVFSVHGRGSEEGGMIKSISSVCENNIIAYSEIGHLFNIQPYIEPAANMVFARNIFAYISTNDTTPLDISVNSYTTGVLANSSSLMHNPSTAKAYNFTAYSSPSINDPVMKLFDYNMYYNAGYNKSSLAPYNWDINSLQDVDPLFVGEVSFPSAYTIWNLTYHDLALLPSSPAYNLPGYRPIQMDLIGLGSSFLFDLSAWARRGIQGQKIQAETYDRMYGLWHEGSYGISPGSSGWPFANNAWAMYHRVDVQGATVFQLAIIPLTSNRLVYLAVNNPSNIVATFNASVSNALPNTMGVYNSSITDYNAMQNNITVFLLPDGGCVIDYFRLL